MLAMLLLLLLLQVKDGFGLPLQASSNVWWTQDLDVAFTGPTVRQVRGAHNQPHPFLVPYPNTTPSQLVLSTPFFCACSAC
jgi:hypothetical protein